jgi:Animal haem peroxidase
VPGDLVDETGQQNRSSEGFTMHGGAEPRGLGAVPRSALYEGPFGRMFRNLPFVAHDRSALIQLGLKMQEQPGVPADNPKIPVGYTYLGQFIDHDITFDPTSQLQRFNDPDALTDFRTPRYDLDSLYGRGPADSPYLYEWADAQFRGVKLLAGRNPDADRDGTPLTRQDLPRNEQGRALVGDPRNDENIIVSQLQLAFIRLHDRVVDRVKMARGLTGRALFEEAQRRVRWHYQWMVVHDFLPRICGADVVGGILKDEGSVAGPTIDLEFYSWENEPFMPVEFSVAAFRFGHSMIRPTYDLNAGVQDVPIFVDDPNPGPFGHLGGFRRLPAGWTIDWRRFVSIDGSRPQPSRRINTRLATPLFRLPPGLDAGRNALAVLNLRRGKALQLPTGQAVAERMGVAPLTTQELGLDQLGLSPEHQAALTPDTPLWYYILREAEVRHNGERLGEVGGRIVAEVLLGLLSGDPSSYLRMQPTWKPDGGIPAARPGEFTLADLLKFATR